MSKTSSRFKKIGVFAYLTSAATTTVTTGGTFVPIVGTFNNVPFEGFHLGVDAIVCDVAGWYEIDWHVSFSSQDGGRTVHFGIAIDGETLTTASNSVMGDFVKYGGEVVNMSGTKVVELAVGSTVQLQLTSDTDADEVTVEHYTTSLAKFYR